MHPHSGLTRERSPHTATGIVPDSHRIPFYSFSKVLLNDCLIPVHNTIAQTCCQPPGQGDGRQQCLRFQDGKEAVSSYDDIGPALPCLFFLHEDFLINAVFQLRHMRDDTYQFVALADRRKSPDRLLKRLVIQSSEPLVHKHRFHTDASGHGLNLIGKSERQR